MARRALLIAAALLLPLAGAQDAAEPTDITIDLRAGGSRDIADVRSLRERPKPRQLFVA